MKTEPIEQTYVERAAGMNLAARVKLVKDAAGLWQKAQTSAHTAIESEMDCINLMREAGIKFNIISGHEQMIFNMEGVEFCRREIIPHLPPGMDMNNIKVCVHLASSMKQPIKTRDELRAARSELQLVFHALGLGDSPKRKEIQQHHARNLFAEFVSSTASLSLLFDKIESEVPMEQWPADKLDEFMESARPIKEKIQRAESLRQKTQEA